MKLGKLLVMAKLTGFLTQICILLRILKVGLNLISHILTDSYISRQHLNSPQQSNNRLLPNSLYHLNSHLYSQPILPNNNKLLKNNLKIYLLNIQSLNNKPDLVHSLIANNKIDIMCLTETWSTEYSTPTFIAATSKTHFFINYSRASRAGGVAAIIHNSITLINKLILRLTLLNSHTYN